MKTTNTNYITLLATALALFAGADGMVIAGQNSATKDQIAKVIDLYAPNSSVQSLTIWMPKATPSITRKSTAAKHATTKLIDLHAPNNPTASITVWTCE